MTSLKEALGSEAQAVTVTLASLASAAAREGAAVDNTSNLFLDVLIFAMFKLSTGTPAGQKSINVYAAGTVDAATPLWPDAVTGADAAITLNSPTNLKLLGAVQAVAASTQYRGGPWSLAALFGGTLPEKWSVVAENQSGNALTATAGDHKIVYQGVFATSA